MATRPANGRGQTRERPAGELIKDLSQQISELVRQEIALARAELTEKGKAAGITAGIFGGAGLFGIGAFLALTACLILALAEGMDGWLAALIVALAYGAIAGVLALRARAKAREATPPVPEQTIETVKEDVKWAKRQAASAGK